MMTRDVAQQALTNTIQFILNLLRTERSPGKDEWLGLVSCAKRILLYGDAAQKRACARILLDGSDVLKESQPDNAAKILHLHVKFRVWCKPLLDDSNNFMDAKPDGDGLPSPSPSA